MDIVRVCKGLVEVIYFLLHPRPDLGFYDYLIVKEVEILSYIKEPLLICTHSGIFGVFSLLSLIDISFSWSKFCLKGFSLVNVCHLSCYCTYLLEIIFASIVHVTSLEPF